MRVSRFFFPGVLVGPYLDYTSYISLVDETVFTVPQSSRGQSHRRRVIPDGRKRVAYGKGLLGLVFLGLFVTLSPKLSYSIALTDWFTQKSVLYR